MQLVGYVVLSSLDPSSDGLDNVKVAYADLDVFAEDERDGIYLGLIFVYHEDLLGGQGYALFVLARQAGRTCHHLPLKCMIALPRHAST